jgi:sn-2 palmitoyl-lipid 9-desaturase
MRRPRFSPNPKLNSFLFIFYSLAIVGGFYFLTWKELLLSYALYFVFDSFGLGFTMHRLLSHQFMSVARPVEIAGMMIGSLCGLGSPLSWSISHQLHHHFSDADKDPHSPSIYGLKVALGYFDMESINRNLRIFAPTLSRMSKDPLIMFLHHWYYLLLFSVYGGFASLFGMKAAICFLIIPCGLSFLATTGLNYFAHLPSVGYRNFETKDQSRNVWWMIFFVFGENWHNNHHRSPKSQTTRVFWWEIDPVMMWVKLFGLPNPQPDKTLKERPINFAETFLEDEESRNIHLMTKSRSVDHNQTTG